jgi:tetratricopeptide (TPR) repeat protein
MYETSIKIEPTADTFNNLGALCLNLDRYQDAARAFEEAIRLEPNLHRIWGNLGDAYRYAGTDPKAASEAYQKATGLSESLLGVNPEDTPTRGCLAVYLSKLGEHERAIREIENSVQLTPSDVVLRRFRIVVYELAGYRDEALRSVESGLTSGVTVSELEDHPDLVELRGDARYQRILQKFREHEN